MNKLKIAKPKIDNKTALCGYDMSVNARYEYTITSDNRVSIRDIVIAKDIMDAYKIVLSVISDLNAKSDEYKWELETLVNTELTLGC